MQIDHCLILAAGLGTRMGEIGKVLPKILWPVFEKTLLELQIDFAQRIGVKQIFINTHFLSDKVQQYIETHALPVTPLLEPELLDVGGAIYNLAQREDVNYSGNLLILNGDQFMCFDDELYRRGLELLTSVDAVLYGISVPAGKGYRETLLDGSTLKTIVPPSDGDHFYNTYSGVGLISLDKLSPMTGVQSFFDTVADYRERSVHMLVPEKYEYWDFGTVARYWESSFTLLRSEKSHFFHFACSAGGIDQTKITKSGYHSNGPVINLNRNFGQNNGDISAIIIEGNATIEEKGIYYQNITDLL